MVHENIKRVIDKFGVDKIAEFSGAMQSKGSRHLYTQLSKDIKDDIDAVLLTVKGPGSIYYASEGRGPGKFPPLANIKSWIKDHQIQPFRNKKGQYISNDKMAFLIGRKLSRVGNKDKATHFLNGWKLSPEFKDELMQAYIDDVKLELINLLNNIIDGDDSIKSEA